jgi:small subunit ribosomal protein S4
MKRKHKLYSRPKKLYDKTRIEEEVVIVKRFGLKNKREIWKAQAKVDSMRGKAKNLISASEEDKEAFFKRLRKIGLNVNSIADVLSLTKEDYLGRRLQTVVAEKKLANTVKAARQLITHKKVIVDGGIVNSPSYVVPVELENKISLKEKRRPVKQVVEAVATENGSEQGE